MSSFGNRGGRGGFSSRGNSGGDDNAFGGGGRGGNFSSRGNFNNDQQGEGSFGNRGGRGGFSSRGNSGGDDNAFGGGGRGGNFSSRGSFNNDQQCEGSFGNRGGRGGFSSRGNSGGDDNAFGGRGGSNFNGGSRGGYNNDQSQESSGGRGSGRGGNFSSRGGFNNDQQGEGSFGNRGGRGGSNFSSNSRGGFNNDPSQESSGGRGGNFSSRGSFNNDQQGEGSFGNRGGRGGFSSRGNSGGDDNSFGGRGGSNFNGGSRGGYSNDQSQENSGGRGGGRGGNFSSRGNFNNDQQGEGSFGNRGGRGGFSSRGNSGGDDNAFGGGGRGGNFSSRGNFNNDQQGEGSFGNRGGRGNSFNSNSRGSFNNDPSQESSGGRGGGGRGGNFSSRGNFNNDQQGEGSFGNRGGRGGFSSRGNSGGDDNGFGGGGRGGSNFNGGSRGGSRDNNFGNEQGEGNYSERPPREEGETVHERTPAGYTPQVRNIEELFKEDVDCEKAYADVVDNDEEVVVENFTEQLVRIQTWEEAEFRPQLLTNVKERSKYLRPRKIQCTTIPFVLDGYDVKAQAETGSGKTAAFVLPIIDSCLRAKAENTFVSTLGTPYALIIGPTRELVLQVYEQAEKFAADTGISVAKAYGQYSISQNHAEIRRGCDILCGTPGRLKQFITNGEVLCNNLRFLVLDEADRLLDVNFKTDIDEIVSSTGFSPKEKRQTLLFSATFPPEIVSSANELLRADAVFITNHRNNPNKRIKQEFLVVPGPMRLGKLAEILSEEAKKAGDGTKIRRTLVFVNTKRMSDMAALYLCEKKVPATSINGDRGQHLREEALRQFRNHQVSVLVATDVCARGIDIKQLDHVINMDMPTDAITYVHRIGRTGRISVGAATSFVTPEDAVLREIYENMRSKSEEIPETLEAIMNGQSSDFAPSTSSNAVPLGNTGSAPSSTPVTAGTSAAPAAAAASADDDW